MHKVLAAVLVATVLSGPAAAASRYVSTQEGSDGANDCLTSTQPCATLAHAVTQFASGDEILVAAGTYKEGIEFNGFDAVSLSGGWNEGFIVQNPATPTVISSKVSRGISVFFSGSGLRSFTMDGITLRKNLNFQQDEELDQLGGGLLVWSGDDTVTEVILSRSIFEGNQAFSGAGATISAENNADVSVAVEGCRFSKNKGAQCAGLFLEGFGALAPAATIEDSSFEKNSALFAGGGFCVLVGDAPASSRTVLLRDTSFAKNKTLGLGGGITVSVSGGDVALGIENSVFMKNKALEFGGAITTIAGPGSTGLLGKVATTSTNNSVSRNKASGFAGGIAVLAVSELTTLADNSFVSTQDIVYGNKAREGGDALIYGDIGTTALLERNDGIAGPAVGQEAFTINDTGIVDADPLFVKAGKDLHLLPGSPAIDIASCLLTSDMDGDARPQGASCDAGADELVP